MGRDRPATTKPRRPKNRSTKTSITFDAQKRKEYLTGFRKRKDERRKKAKEKIEEEMRKEKAKAREKARSEVTGLASDAKASSSHRVIPEIEHLLPTRTEDFGSHTVDVTQIQSFGSQFEAPVAEEPEEEVRY